MPKQQTIAIDIDDVLALNAASFVAFSNSHWGTNLTVDDFQEDFCAMWGVDVEEVQRRMLEYGTLGVVAHHPVIETAKPVLQELHKRFNLVIVTSRRKILADHTAEWIRNYFGDLFTDIHHAGIFDELKQASFHMTKAQICKDIGADYLVDDHPKHCFAVAEAGIKAVLFGDYPWNRDDPLPEGVVRAKDWAAVKEYFDAQP